MAEGVYFFWFAWIFWVAVAYLVPRSKIGSFLKVWILLIIAAANSYVIISNLTISAALLVILSGGLTLLAQSDNKYLTIFTAFTAMITYDCVLIWEHDVPIWLIIPRAIFLPLAVSAMIIYLTKGFVNRLAVTVMGVCGAELFYGVWLSGYHIPYIAGSKLFLDNLVVIIAMITCVQLLQIGYDMIISKHNSHRSTPVFFEEVKKDIR